MRHRPTLLVIMTDDTLRWRGGWARLGSWRGRPDVAYLSVGADRPPTPEIVDRCVGLLRGRGYSAVVTSALAAADALPFLDAGFSVRERLHLLAHAMGDLPLPAQATPSSRFRVAEGNDGLLAYAVTGRAGQHGYLQRLAVHPGVRREGYGRAIVLDGLRWLRRHGATQALVN